MSSILMMSWGLSRGNYGVKIFLKAEAEREHHFFWNSLILLTHQSFFFHYFVPKLVSVKEQDSLDRDLLQHRKRQERP